MPCLPRFLPEFLMEICEAGEEEARKSTLLRSAPLVRDLAECIFTSQLSPAVSQGTEVEIFEAFQLRHHSLLHSILNTTYRECVHNDAFGKLISPHSHSHHSMSSEKARQTCEECRYFLLWVVWSCLFAPPFPPSAPFVCPPLSSFGLLVCRSSSTNALSIHSSGQRGTSREDRAAYKFWRQLSVDFWDDKDEDD